MVYSVLVLLSLSPFFSDSFSPEELKTAAQLRDQAAAGNGAWDLVESLTTEVGPRLAGSPGDKAAVKWAQAKFNELGFDKVWTEEVAFPYWIRGTEEASVISPFPQGLTICALGGSVGTPEAGIEAPIVEVPNYAALAQMDRAKVEGRIVYISNRMERHRTGKGYGQAVIARGKGPSAAAELGAVALLIRSIGTDTHRFPHTGGTNYTKDIARIPAAALSNPDADLLSNMVRRGKEIRVRLKLTCRNAGMTTSHNVIGEYTGRENPEQVILLGAHLDSWDLGTGAIDDGAGCAIVTEAARLISLLPERPRRTLRVVLYANEEGGLFGGRAYAAAHRNDLNNHMIAGESDLGADRIWKFSTNVAEPALPLMKSMAELMAPLGIEMGNNKAGGGPDIGPMHRLGMPVITFSQDATRYFDLHHTADDTLDKIDPEALAQNVAAYVVFAYLSAEAKIKFSH